MSINVTVHGNPISIKKGKMVTHDADYEFERRRRMRLQQVRQQSKEIAADVRNRVRKEKEKQLSKVEQKGEQDLKRWQARKLMSLQQQYQDCLKEVGSAHTKAALEPDPNEILNELAAKNKLEADKRGKQATEMKRNDDKQKRFESEKPSELRKSVRKMEDARSAMVTKLNQGKMSPKKKKKKRKKVATDINIMNNLVSETDSTENFISDGENISANIITDKFPRKSAQSTCENSFALSSSHSDLNDTVGSRSPNSPRKSKQRESLDGFKKITKISDRILQRKLIEEHECECEDEGIHFLNKIQKPEICTRDSYKANLQMDSYKICDIQGEKEPKQSKNGLPYVPTTTLRPDSHTHISDSQPSKVKYYDHLNHFRKEYDAQPVVQKISKDSIQIHPPLDRSESNEFIRTMNSRDKIAHDRGIRAMEKEQIHKDYKQLMEELPLLQRQERLASMRTHNPAFHMPEDRLQELERRRQTKIENIFEKYYHKSKNLETPLVTIRPVQKTPPAEDMKFPFRALDVTESPVQLNVAEWKSEERPMDFETRQQSQEEDLQNRQKALVDLLQRVNKQRELLLQEVSTLPPSSNLQKILQDEEILQSTFINEEDSQGSSKESLKEKVKVSKVSTGTSPLSVIHPSKHKTIIEKEGNKRSLPSTSSSDTSTEVIKKKKHKKVKQKKQKKLIKSEGTQTSPLLRTSQSNSPKSSNHSLKPEKIKYYCLCKTPTTKSTNVCNCDELYKEDARKLCEIVIKMSNQSEVKVCNDDEQPDGKKVILNLNKPTKKSIRSPTNGYDVSSSTTYMSLLDGIAQQKNTKPSTTPKHKQQCKDLLCRKPQQTNIYQADRSKTQKITSISDPNKKEITPTLLRYIQKLLRMSRKSIDELTVSTISDVSTPGASIIETVENSSPFVQLQNVMQYYNLSVNDIQEHLTASDTSKSSVEYSKTEVKEKNRTRSSVEASREQSRKTSPLHIQDKRLSQPGSPREPEPQKLPLRCSSPTESLRSPRDHEDVVELVKETFGLNQDDMQQIPYANILSRYKDLTQNCCDRITKLTEMIDNVRIEKERLLSPDSSDKYETSVTSYLELPKMTNDSTRIESNANKTCCHSNSSSTSSSMSQDAVDRYLLAVEKIPSQRPSPTTGRNVDYDVDEIPVSENHFNKNQNQDIFVPMLQGIPKYNEPTENQAINLLNSPVKQFLLNSKSKPPPSLLRNADKYNLNIDMTPHELSSIAELDTIISSRNISEVVIHRARSPEERIPSRDESVPEQSKNETSEYNTITPEHKALQEDSCMCPRKQRADEVDFQRKCAPKRSALKKSSRSSSPSQERPTPNSEVSGVQSLNSDRSTSSPEDMETILRTMGLGWAVSTLKKTHEALALSSSSSSVEASFRKRVSFKDSSSSNSNSDVSLKDVLSKEFMKKISTSTLLTDISGISLHLQEFQDMSDMRDTKNQNRDGSQQRTSTPVQQSKSTDSKKDLFTGDSDLSSVRIHSEEFFLSLPNVSLDTNKSLSKSKEN